MAQISAASSSCNLTRTWQDVGARTSWSARHAWYNIWLVSVWCWMLMTLACGALAQEISTTMWDIASMAHTLSALPQKDCLLLCLKEVSECTAMQRCSYVRIAEQSIPVKICKAGKCSVIFYWGQWLHLKLHIDLMMEKNSPSFALRFVLIALSCLQGDSKSPLMSKSKLSPWTRLSWLVWACLHVLIRQVLAFSPMRMMNEW